MDFLLPKLSATMETAKVGQWFRAVGDPVRQGEPLVELETDKAAMEVEAPVDGVLAEVLAAVGDELPIGAVLARIAQAGVVAAPVAAMPVAVAQVALSVVAPVAVAPIAALLPAFVPKSGPPRAFASPLARRLAGLNGVDLAQVTGTGPKSRIRKRDVLSAAPATPSPGFVPLSPLRAGIAAAVTLSRQTIPSFVLDRWVETTALAQARAALAPQVLAQTNVNLTLTDFLLQALAGGMAMTPGIADRYAMQNGQPGRILADSVAIGLVVAVPDGVMIPVLHGLAGATLAAIAATRVAAVQRARAGRLTQADAAPVGLSLSNIGRDGADRFEAIIGPGQSGILAVGRQHARVIPRADGLAVAQGINLTFSVDHRLIDGVAGAAFLGRLAGRLEDGPWVA